MHSEVLVCFFHVMNEYPTYGVWCIQRSTAGQHGFSRWFCINRFGAAVLLLRVYIPRPGTWNMGTWQLDPGNEVWGKVNLLLPEHELLIDSIILCRTTAILYPPNT